VSTMPPTALMLVKNDMVLGHFNNYTEIGYHFGIVCAGGGVINFRGKPMNPTYVLETDPRIMHPGHGFTKHGAVSNWCKYHMKNNLPGYQIYRYLL